MAVEPSALPRANYRAMVDKIPDGLYVKCQGSECGELLYRKDLEKNTWVCPKCGFHFRLGARDRLNTLLDAGSLREMDTHLVTLNPLEMPEYEKKIAKYQKITGDHEAVITGEAEIEGYPVVIGITNAFFLMGSMGSVVGEKIARAMERAVELRSPCIMISGSGGGARMHEGILSLMQMAKTCAAVARMQAAGILYITILSDPTMAGVYASWASLGDVIIAEPGAMIGFAGQRVFANTGSGMDANIQTSEYQQACGLIDMVLPRDEIRATVERLLAIAYATPTHAHDAIAFGSEGTK